MDEQIAKITLSWEITDFDLADYSNGKYIVSPVFNLDNLHNTEWVLKLGLPRIGYFTVQLVRCEADKGPDEVTLCSSLFLVGHEDKKLIGASKESLLKRNDKIESSMQLCELILFEYVHWSRNVLTIQCVMSGPSLSNISPVSYIGITNVMASTFEFTWKASPELLRSESSRVINSDKTYCYINLLRKPVAPQGVNFECEIVGSVSQCVCVIHNVGANQCLSSSPTFVLTMGNQIYKNHISVSGSNLFVETKVVKMFYFNCKFRISDGSYVSRDAIEVPVPKLTVPSSWQSLGEDLRKMYSKQSLCDFSFLTDGGEVFNVHSVILASRSPVFHRMLNSDFKETNTKVMSIVDTDAGTMRSFLNFVYGDKVDDLDFDAARKLYIVADKYDVSELKEICAAFFLDTLSVDNVCDVLELAERYSESEMKKAVKSFISSNTELVLSSDKWKEFHKNNLLISVGILQVLALKQ